MPRRDLPIQLIRRPTSRRRRALSFVDVIAALVLVGLLVALWVPAVAKTRERAKRQLCTSRLQQIGNALMFYRQANAGHDPRTLYKPGAQPDVSNAGAAAPDPFGPGGPPANNVPAALFLLLRAQNLSPSVVICPAAGDRFRPDDFEGLDSGVRSNFTDVRRNVGYSLFYTYTAAGPSAILGSPIGAGVAGANPVGGPLIADLNPGAAAAVGAVSTADLNNAGALRYRRANSNNHGKAGQFVLYDDFSVQWFTTPFAGVLVGTYPDNIYTTRRNTVVDTPVDASDSILLPAEE